MTTAANKIQDGFKNPTPEFVIDIMPTLKQQLEDGNLAVIKAEGINAFWVQVETGHFTAMQRAELRDMSKLQWKTAVMNQYSKPDEWFSGHVYSIQEALRVENVLMPDDVPDIDHIHRANLVRNFGVKEQIAF